MPTSEMSVEVRRLGLDRSSGRSCEKAPLKSKDIPGATRSTFGKLSLMTRVGGSSRDALAAALNAAGLDGQ